MTDQAILDQARLDAARAAATAGITVHDAADPAGVAGIGEVFDRIWGTVSSGPVLQDEVLRVYALTGQYLVLARDAAGGDVIAASTGMFAAPAGTALHSHITGVLPSGLGRSVGYAIKLHQRVWALERGIELITWTYDPLVRRNAWFNLAKLAARPARYLVDFYGAMPDAINAGDASDRLYLHWPLTSPAVVRACSGESAACDLDTLRHRGYQPLVTVGADGRTPEVRAMAEGGTRLLVQVPASIETLRREDVALARHWRTVVRDAVLPAMTDGVRIIGMAKDGWYVLGADDSPDESTGTRTQASTKGDGA